MKLDGTWIGVGVAALVAGAVIFAQQDGLDAPGSTDVAGEERRAATPDRAKACRSLSGEVAARLDACLAELKPAPLSKDAAGALADGKVFVAGPALQVEHLEQVELKGAAEARSALMGLDEAAAAKALRDSGVRSLVAYRDVTGALDRDGRVLSRLAHHDFLEWFQLRYVTEELMIYTVRSSSARVPLATGDQLLAGLRARLSGEPARKQTWTPDAVRLIGAMRLQGQTLAIRHEVGNDLERVLDELASKLRREWDRGVGIYGHGRLEDRIGDVRLELHVVMERAAVEPRSHFALFDLFEPGVDGMIFSHGDKVPVEKRKFTFMPGSEATVRSIKSADDFLRLAVKEGGWRDARPWEDGSTKLDVIRTQHFLESRRGGGPAVRLYRGLPEVPMDEVTDENVRQMLVDGAEWWLRNMRADGSINYKFWPEQNRMSDDYNEVRHILATRDLMDTYRYRPDPRYAAGAREAMDWLMQYAVHDTDAPTGVLPHPPEGTMLFRYRNNQKLGTVAVALLGWVEWAKATGDHSQDANIRKMAKFVLHMQEDNGKFDPYYVPKGHGYYGQKNDIVPGEAALALGEVAEYFGEKNWVEFFPKFLDFYEPWFRERAKNKNAYGRWPHDTYDNTTRLDLVQFGPWAVMACKQYYALTGDERAAAFGLEVADWMIENYQWRAERSPFPDYVGGYYKMPTELPAMQTFCYSEGTAAAYTIAAKFRPETKDRYDRSTREAIRFLRLMQYDDLDAYYLAESDLIHGGVKYAMNENKIRIDYVGHGLSTLSQYLDARASDPAVSFKPAPLDPAGAPNPNRVAGRAPRGAIGGETVPDDVEGPEESAD